MIARVIAFVTHNRLLVLVLGLLVLAGGYLSYRTLPVDAFPDASPNLVQVFTVTEGLAPEEVEQHITYPVETAMNGLPGVETVRSISVFGLSVVSLYFRDGMDIYFCRQLVNERLQEARGEIPEGFGEPELGPISSVMGRVLYYYLEDEKGACSLEELRRIQDTIIKPQLQAVPGVTEVLGIGGFEKEYQVVVDPDALLRYDLALSEVVARIKANNLNTGAQFLEKNGEEYVVRSVGLATSLDDLQRIVVKSERGTPLFLEQVAEVRVGGAVRRGVQIRNGAGEVVAGQVLRLYGTNASEVIGRVEKKIAEINRTLPQGVRIVPYYEQRTLVQACVATVTGALAQGIVLVVIVLCVFLGGLRSSAVVILSLPFSLLFALMGMKYFHISANLMSLGGLAIAIGMLVDGTIVMVENVDRLLREGGRGASVRAVVVQACTEVGRPVVFAIGIIVIVFLPLFTLQGMEGKTFRPLAHTVALAMLGSLLYAALVAPALSSLVMRFPHRARTAPAEVATAVRVGLFLYRPVVQFFVRRRFLAVALGAGLVVLGLAIFPRLGSEFTPTLEEGSITLRMTLAPSSALEECKRVATLVEKRLMRIPEIASVVTRIGRGEVGADTDPTNITESYILLQPKKQWRQARNQEQLREQIRRELGEVPGAQANFSQPIAMEIEELLEGVRAQLAVKLFGNDLDLLKQKADEIAAVLSTVPGAADVQAAQVGGSPQLLIRINREAIARRGINVADVQEVIRTAVGGENAGYVFEGVSRVAISVRFPEEFRHTPQAIGKILVPAPDGTRVPLTELAALQEIVGPRQITREQNQRFITVQCNVVGRDIGGFVKQGQAVIERQVKLPANYFLTWGGEFELQQQANRRLAMVIPATLLIIVLLLFSNFNSLRNSLLILLNIPLALVGGVVALWLSGQHLSVPASVGFIALFGIALENGMVLVSCLNQLLQEGVPLDEASVRGACLRLRAVLMTALTTILGLIPLLLARGAASEVQRPLATVVLGGLVTSTVLTLLVIPALYKWFANPVADPRAAQETLAP